MKHRIFQSPTRSGKTVTAGRRVMHFLVLLLISTWMPSAEAADRPNVVFLFTDDQRADTIAALGNAQVRTPELDRLVHSGTTFTQAYCMGSMQGAVCVPSRAMLLAGRSLFRVNEKLSDQQTWPEQFAKAGYRTFISGKWHNGGQSVTRVFQSGKAVFVGGMGDPYNLTVHDLAEGKLVNRRTTRKHSVELFADSAVEFLKEQDAQQPFLCYVSFNLPHDPRTAPEEYHHLYNTNQPPIPKNFMPQHPFNNGEMVVRDEKLAPWPRTQKIVRQHLADYYATITFIDTQIGRIIGALDDLRLRESTVVVFASDHGLAIGSHGLFGKQNLYEHSMRAPLVFAGPGIPAGKKVDSLCYLFDVFPTLGAMLDIEPPAQSEGINLLPAMLENQEARPWILTAYRKYQRAVRDERWKLIAYPHINKTQLFDLAEDPVEVNDLSQRREHSTQLEKMRALLQEAQDYFGDNQPLFVSNPQPEKLDLDSEPTR